ncbi:MAG: hypothetical protein JWM60_2900 [Solirubrobacterales bacterium]|nr:hypothetical protein [Solirubrobacterales bacterium]
MDSLARFRCAQEENGIYERALAELKAGAKRSHWMWFVFPQLAGLGRSEMSRRYAISSLAEARAYLADPVLGARLRESAAALLGHEGIGAEQIFGPVDALKLRSSITLFARADPGEALLGSVLDRYFAGAGDPATDALLAGAERP